jgi:virginiamycin B lyase
MDKRGNLREFQIPTREAAPLGIATGSDHNVWFTEFRGNKIGVLRPVVEHE